MKCKNCKEEMILNKSQKYQYSLSGLENIFLNNVQVYSCADCDSQVPVIPKILRLHNTIAEAIVCKKSFLSGSEIRFLRKNLRYKSQDWAKLLRTDKSVYSRWENNSQSVSPQSDLLIRYLYLRLLEEKTGIWLEKKIAESLSDVKNERVAIIIDVEQIEKYVYLLFEEFDGVMKIQDNKQIFDINLDDNNIYLSEIEKSLPLDAISNYGIEIQARANQELALTS